MGSEDGVHALEGLADSGSEDLFLLEQGVEMILFFVVVHGREVHAVAWCVRGGWAREVEWVCW